MLTTEELDIIYEWGMTTELPYRKAPTAEGYSNQPIGMCWLKGTGKGFHGVRESLIDDKRVIDILSRDEVLFATGAMFYAGTKLPKHRDPPVYPHRYRRIHVPLVVPPDCFMVWDGEKKPWESGVYSVWDVQDVTHEAYNLSDDTLEFIFIDIKK